MRATAATLALVAWLGSAEDAMAQPVYRCEADGKVTYSHEPCRGARVVDTTPTQGMDKASGKSRKGADVTRAEHDEMMGKALQPLTGMTPEQRRVYHKRFKLSAAAKLECQKLDGELAETATAQTARSPVNEDRLLKQRERFRELRC